MKNNKIKLLFLALTVFVSLAAKQTTVIFDLGKVVLFPDKGKAFDAFALNETINYFISYGMPSEKQFFKYLKEFYGSDIGGSSYPACFRPWFTGKITGKELYKDICLKADCSNLYDVQKNFVKSCAKNLKPKRMHKVQYAEKKAVRYICELLNSVDANNKPIKVMVLSNWDSESFVLLRQKYKKLFDIIGDKNIIISGDIGMMKPDKNIFEYLLNNYALKAEDCFFIDDDFDNIYSARECGINAVMHKDWARTPYRLKKLGLEYKIAETAGFIKSLAENCL